MRILEHRGSRRDMNNTDGARMCPLITSDWDWPEDSVVQQLRISMTTFRVLSWTAAAKIAKATGYETARCFAIIYESPYILFTTSCPSLQMPHDIM
jgi:hypothetical protein